MKYNFSSKKFFILLFFVCLLFIIVVINAYMYLPEKTQTNDVGAITINKSVQVEQADQNETEDKKTSDEDSQKISLPKVKDEIEIVDIETPNGVNVSEETTQNAPELSTEEKAANILKDAQKYRAARQYIKALDEFQKLSAISSDKNILATSYDGIASLYAINKRYGTALSYAIKAYNTYPTSEREMTLARLYYTTGDIEKATQRVNNILRRDFADDRW